MSLLPCFVEKRPIRLRLEMRLNDTPNAIGWTTLRYATIPVLPCVHVGSIFLEMLQWCINVLMGATWMDTLGLWCLTCVGINSWEQLAPYLILDSRQWAKPCQVHALLGGLWCLTCVGINSWEWFAPYLILDSRQWANTCQEHTFLFFFKKGVSADTHLHKRRI